MIRLIILLVLNLSLCLKANEHKGFDDSILHTINWVGAKENIDVHNDDTLEEEVLLTTHRNEKYKCTIPMIADKDKEKKLDVNTGISPAELLVPLFITGSCSYRIESYWTYEICHGRYIKQFHEEREGKSMKSQDYILGKFNQSLTDKLLETYKNIHQEHEKIQYTKVDGAKLPAVPVDMVDGTVCDLNGEPRSARVYYVCDVQGKNEVYSLKETTTCSYEIIILTSLLCVHSLYKPEKQIENPINCYPVENAGVKPKSLLAMEASSMKTRYQKLGDYRKSSKDQRKIAVFKVDPKDGVLKMEIIEGAGNVEYAAAATLESLEKSLSSNIPTTTPLLDKQPVIDFLEGRNCLSGGAGWWKYELCYGQYVRQYHIDKLGEQSIVLGVFKVDAHIEWLKKNPHKRPQKGVRTYLHHFYTDGTMCDKTGKPRQTEVKLKCLEKAPSPTSVLLYLLESRTCEYELTVQSSLICDILDLADENGLVPGSLSNAINSQEPNEVIND